MCKYRRSAGSVHALYCLMQKQHEQAEKDLWSPDVDRDAYLKGRAEGWVQAVLFVKKYWTEMKAKQQEARHGNSRSA